MLKLTKTGIGLLTRQYRSVLKKCLLINLGSFAYFSLYGASALHWETSKTIDGNIYWVYCDSYENCGAIGGGYVYATFDYTDANVLYLHNNGYTGSVTNGSGALVTSGGVYSALNNYYRKEDLGGRQVIDFTRYFKSGKLVLKSENLGVDLTAESENLPSNLTSKIGGFATNHPPRLGAFVKCEKACSRLSERFLAKLRKNRAFEDIASADAGTFLFVQETNKNVMDSFSQNARFLNNKSTKLR